MIKPFLVRSGGKLSSVLSELEGTIGLVMTMGALHEGHLDLVREAHKRVDHVVVTIFVNPLQFGADEDLDSYPRDLDADLEKLSEAEADVVFVPSVEVMYPQSNPQISIRVGDMAQILEGESRPGHFDGVVQIVSKMFNLVNPDVAFFGQKDAQQLAIIRQLVKEMDYRIEIVSVPTRRDPDGLALSSRNRYLSETEREQATVLYKALQLGVQTAAATGSAKSVLDITNQTLLEAEGLSLDYVALVDPVTLEEIDDSSFTAAVLLVAAWIGNLRLIDNQLVVLGGRSNFGGSFSLNK